MVDLWTKPHQARLIRFLWLSFRSVLNLSNLLKKPFEFGQVSNFQVIYEVSSNKQILTNSSIKHSKYFSNQHPSEIAIFRISISTWKKVHRLRVKNLTECFEQNHCNLQTVFTNISIVFCVSPNKLASCGIQKLHQDTVHLLSRRTVRGSWTPRTERQGNQEPRKFQIQRDGNVFLMIWTVN